MQHQLWCYHQTFGIHTKPCPAQLDLTLCLIHTRVKAKQSLFPSTSHQSFDQYKCKEWSKKCFKQLQRRRDLQFVIIVEPIRSFGANACPIRCLQWEGSENWPGTLSLASPQCRVFYSPWFSSPDAPSLTQRFKVTYSTTPITGTIQKLPEIGH